MSALARAAEIWPQHVALVAVGVVARPRVLARPHLRVIEAPKPRSPEAERSHKHRLLKAKGRAVYGVSPRRDPALLMLLEAGRITDEESRDPKAVAAALTKFIDDAATRWIRK